MGTPNEVNPSYWITTGPETAYPAFTGADPGADAVVVGAGIFGLTTAVLLARAGVRVALLDAGPVAAGVTGYTTAKVSSLHGLVYADLAGSLGEDTARTYGEANEAAIAQVATLVDELGIDCAFERLPAYTYTEDAGLVRKLQDEAETAARLGLPASFVTDADLPYPVAGAVRFEDQAQFHPRRYCVGLAEWLVAQGHPVFEHTRVLDVDEDGGGCRVETEAGELRAGHVVVATHIPFADPGMLFARTHPERSYAITATLRGPAPSGMFISAEEPTRSVRPIVAGGNEVLIGGEGHKVGQDPDTRRRYEALERWAKERFDVVSLDTRWSAQDYMSPDGMPFIGPLGPGAKRRHTATGFAKWGMTNGTVAAAIITDRIQGRENPWAAVFDSNRINLTASAKDLVKENVDVAKRFVGDRLAALRAPKAEALAPGEGCIAQVGGHRMAVHRDDNGELHAVSARCTHLGCYVAWNTAERSWDCPCHGSRFDADGRVIQGPATKDLERAED